MKDGIVLIPVFTVICKSGVMGYRRISDSLRLQCRNLFLAGARISSISKSLGISWKSAKKHALVVGGTADKPRSGRPRALEN